MPRINPPFSLTLTLFFLSLLPAMGQNSDTLEKSSDTLWEKGAIISFNFSQVALKNWTAGGRNSIAGSGVANLFADLRKGKMSWKNSLDMSYGLLSQEKDPFIKNDDEIQLASQVGRKLREDLFFRARIDLRSQFAPGYGFPAKDSVLISDFLAPGYAKGGLGIGYDPNEHFDVTIAPIASKITMVRNEELAAQGAYGVEPGRNLRYEFGGNLSASIKKKLFSNTSLRSEIGLFSNYLEEPGNIDVNFSFLLNMKVNSFLKASISTDMIYDDDIMVAVDTDEDGIPDKSGPRLQFKEVINIGLSFNFGQAEE